MFIIIIIIMIVLGYENKVEWRNEILIGTMEMVHWIYF
jgi:hypothetical protein